MRWFRFAVLLVIATVLQAGPVDVIAVVNPDIKPDLLVILLVFFAVHCNPSEAIIISFTVGFAADIIAVGCPMGPQIISFGLFGTALANLHRVIAIRKMPYQSLAIFIISILTTISAHFLTFLRTQPSTPDIYVLFGTALYSALIGPFLFLPCAWWIRIKKHRFGR